MMLLWCYLLLVSWYEFVEIVSCCWRNKIICEFLFRRDVLYFSFSIYFVSAQHQAGCFLRRWRTKKEFQWWQQPVSVSSPVKGMLFDDERKTQWRTEPSELFYPVRPPVATNFFEVAVLVVNSRRSKAKNKIETRILFSLSFLGCNRVGTVLIFYQWLIKRRKRCTEDAYDCFSKAHKKYDCHNKEKPINQLPKNERFGFCSSGILEFRFIDLTIRKGGDLHC